MDQSLLSSRAIMGMYFARLEADPGMGWIDGVSNLFGSDQASALACSFVICATCPSAIAVPPKICQQ